MKVTIFLIRHGETDWNVQNRKQGQLDEARLTEKGKKQVGILRRELSGVKFDLVFSSPLRRSLDTARIALPDAEISIADRMTERDFGKLGGLTREEIRERYPEIQKVKDETGTTPWFPGSERLEDLEKRGREFLEEIARKNPGKMIAVFTHSGIIEAIMAGLHGLPMTEKEKFAHNPCGYSVIEYENGKFRVKILNHNAHLRGIG